MDMRADFLASFSGSKDSNYRYFWLLVNLGRVDIISKQWVKFGGDSRVFIQTVQADTKELHGRVADVLLRINLLILTDIVCRRRLKS